MAVQSGRICLNGVSTTQHQHRISHSRPLTIVQSNKSFRRGKASQQATKRHALNVHTTFSILADGERCEQTKKTTFYTVQIVHGHASSVSAFSGNKCIYVAIKYRELVDTHSGTHTHTHRNARNRHGHSDKLLNLFEFIRQLACAARAERKQDVRVEAIFRVHHLGVRACAARCVHTRFERQVICRHFCFVATRARARANRGKL